MKRKKEQKREIDEEKETCVRGAKLFSFSLRNLFSMLSLEDSRESHIEEKSLFYL